MKETSNLMTLNQAVESAHFRQLNWNEIVIRGDYVGNDRQEFEPWVGPSGFQAGTFVMPIFRCCKKH